MTQSVVQNQNEKRKIHTAQLKHDNNIKYLKSLFHIIAFMIAVLPGDEGYDFFFPGFCVKFAHSKGFSSNLFSHLHNDDV